MKDDLDVDWDLVASIFIALDACVSGLLLILSLSYSVDYDGEPMDRAECCIATNPCLPCLGKNI
jgi:hypothetical protein